MEKPEFKYRVGVVVETPHGAFLTQEVKDKAREEALGIIEAKRLAALAVSNKTLANRYSAGKSIISGGRFSLPGGGPSLADFEEAGEIKLVEEIGIQVIERPNEDSSLLFPDIDKLPEEVGSRIEQVMRKTAIREIKEELGITPEEVNLKALSQIMGEARRHLIYIVALDGEIKITDPNISGIGFIDQKHVIPLSKFFFQGHVRSLFTQYICNPGRDSYAKAFASRLTLPFDLVEGWFTDEVSAYNYLSGKGRQKTPFPRMLESKPTFRIRGKDGKIRELRPDSDTFTVSRAAKLIPRSPSENIPPSDRGPDSIVKVRRSPSNPTMPKVTIEKKPA